MRAAFLVMMACSGGAPSEPPAPASPPPTTTEVAQPVAPAEPAPPTEGRFAASHILIQHDQAVGTRNTRTPTEARTLAESLHHRVVAGEDFVALAREHSDDPNGARGGTIGVYSAGTMMPAFEAAVASVEPGAIAPVTETPYGMHIIRRDALVEGRFRHIVVGYAGATGSASTRDEAQARATLEQAEERLKAGEAWDAVCADISEDSLALHGGDLGLIAPGQMVPAFDDAAFPLSAGERTGPIKTPYGYHLIERY